MEVKSTVKPVDYIDSMEFLEKRVEGVIQGKEDELLWILEHKSVYTAGIRSDDKDLIDKNIKLIKTNRGGKITHHAPGQKVIYFVLDLNKRKKDIRLLVNKIEDCIIEILKSYKITSHRDKKNIGIWINSKKETKKIAAIGIKVKKWIAYHGFSLNVNNNLSKYDAIVSCGIRNKGITSLKEIGINKYDKIDNIIIEKFLNTFL